MARPWDHPGDHSGESAELFYLRHLAGAVAGIGDMLVANDVNQEKIMATLDNLTTAVAGLGQAVTDAVARLDAAGAAEAAATVALQGQVTDLQGQVATLQADAVDPTALQALVDQVNTIAASVAAIATGAPPTPVPAV